MENVKENQEITPINPLVFERFNAIAKSIITNGTACITGTGGAGKTGLTMWLARTFMNSPEYEVNKQNIVMIESCNNFIFKFDEVPYVDCSEVMDVPRLPAVIANVSSMKKVSEQKEYIRRYFIEEFNYMKYLNTKYKGINPYLKVYFIDEIPILFNRYSLIGDKNEDMYSVFTTGRNFGMHFVGIGRRLADFPTRCFVESCSTFVFGVIDGENDLGKVKGMYPNKEVKKKVVDAITNLTPRSFIFYDKKARRIDEITTPEWKQQGMPQKYLVQPVNSLKSGFVRTILRW